MSMLVRCFLELLEGSMAYTAQDAIPGGEEKWQVWKGEGIAALLLQGL